MAKDDETPGPKPEEQVVRDRVAGSMPATRRLDVAMKDRRQVKVQLPRREIVVDAREARRAIRWGQAQDERVVALDQAMKVRRRVNKAVEQGLPKVEAAAPTDTGGSRKLVMVVAIVGALVVIGLMVLMASKLM